MGSQARWTPQLHPAAMLSKNREEHLLPNLVGSEALQLRPFHTSRNSPSNYQPRAGKPGNRVRGADGRGTRSDQCRSRKCGRLPLSGGDPIADGPKGKEPTACLCRAAILRCSRLSVGHNRMSGAPAVGGSSKSDGPRVARHRVRDQPIAANSSASIPVSRQGLNPPRTGCNCDFV